MHLLADPYFLTLAVLAVCLLGLSKGGFFGLGVMSLPLLSLVVHPLAAAAMLIPVTIAQDTLTMWIYRRDWSAWNLKVMLPGMAAGMAVATLFAATLRPEHIRLLIGILAALFVLRQWLGERYARLTFRPNTATGLGFGALGGFVTLLANAGGPIWQFHLLPQSMERRFYVGTMAMLFACSNLMKLPAYTSLGLMTWDNLSVGVALMPLAFATNYLGIWLVRRTPTVLFFRIAYVIMLFVAVELIRGALVDIWQAQ